MLARNDLSAAELGITEAERSALISVRNRMERGEFQQNDQTNEKTYFNMADWCQCIRGHAKRELGDGNVWGPGPHFGGPDHPAFPLFSLRGRQSMFSCNIDEALEQLNKYLSTGEARWSDEETYTCLQTPF